MGNKRKECVSFVPTASIPRIKLPTSASTRIMFLAHLLATLFSFAGGTFPVVANASTILWVFLPSVRAFLAVCLVWPRSMPTRGAEKGTLSRTVVDNQVVIPTLLVPVDFMAPLAPFRIFRALSADGPLRITRFILGCVTLSLLMLVLSLVYPVVFKVVCLTFVSGKPPVK